MNAWFGGKIMADFVALEAMYVYKQIDKRLEDKYLKSTKKYAVAKSCTFDGYKTCLVNGKVWYKEQMLSQIKKHVV